MLRLTMPKVSVIVPNYNHARFLEQRFNSILEQTFQDFEIVYLDDASTDDSARVLARFENDPRCAGRLRVILNGTNSGSPFKQWNKGVGAAQGDYCWIAEADDDADPRLLERLVELLDAHPSVGVAYCQSLSVDAAGAVIGSLRSWTDDLDAGRWERDWINNGRDECRRFLAIKNTLPNASAVLFRRSVFQDAGGAEESMRLCGDWKTWFKMLLICDVAFVAEPLNRFRSHGASVREGGTRAAQLAEEAYRVVEFVGQQISLSPRARRKACERIAAEWVEPVIHLKSNAAHKRSRTIYQLARRVDPHLHRHLWRETRRVVRRRMRARFSRSN
jgi:glycosyltransferase involved in cell wall biosynthesis